jgi:hypothetical protein
MLKLKIKNQKVSGIGSMACLENTCLTCGHSWWDNRGGKCPECGSIEVYTTSDEPVEKEIDDDE